MQTQATDLSTQVNWDQYRNHLNSNSIAHKAHRWYVLRVQEMFRSLQLNSLHQITPAVVNGYIKHALQRRDLNDWQIGQVIDAIRILCVGLLDRNQYETILWDEFRLTAKSINSDHATLAREAVLDNTGRGLGNGCACV